MFKLVYCLRRKPQPDGRGVPAVLARRPRTARRRASRTARDQAVRPGPQHVPELIPVFQRRNGGSPEPYDGVAEIWFDSLEALGSEDPAVQQAAADLLADEGNFIDLAQSPLWIAQENVVIA